MNFDILKKINISSIAKGAGNTLNVIKKAIPVYKEIKPYITKEKSIMNKPEIEEKKESKEDSEYNDSLTFFQ